ncbi:MAG: TrkH family potassium uptake protein [Bacteroidota bacterium]|nr:TrkH family potassium uptake protein [Bacteroidota bacterium]
MSRRFFNTSLNIRLIVNLLGLVLIIEAIFMLFSLFFAIYFGEAEYKAFLYAIVITFVVGLSTYLFTKKKLVNEFSTRESFLLVTLSWVVMSLFGALPFILSGKLGFTDAFFETVSGFTAAGASILTDIEGMPKSLLFWRSETHWIGGMGIIVLFVALFPFLKTNRMQLFSAEASVVVEGKAFPKILDISRTVWLVYVALTFIETFFLILGGMNLFEALSHSFGTMATGGFSTRNNSVAAFSPYIQYVITFFMILAGVNFSLYLFMLKNRFNKVFSNEELRYYLVITFVVTIIIFASLFFNDKSRGIEIAFRESLFQTVSILTTTGFATADYLTWNNAAIVLIFIMMFMGASAGSTAGNIKIIRHILFLKNLKAFYRKMIHHEAISVVRYNKNLVSSETANNALVFILAYILITVFSILFVTATGVDIETSIGAVVATIGCIGPGIGKVGPTGNYAEFSGGIKYFLSFLMILGRLEIFTVIILFTRNFWRG